MLPFPRNTSAGLPPTASQPTRRGWAAWQVVALVASWLTVAGNLPLWQQLWALPEVNGLRGLAFVAGFGVLVWGVLAALLSLLAWPGVFKPVAVVSLFSAASASHFMQAYSAVIDPTMMLNVLHTDAREVKDLLSVGFVWTLLWQAALPAWWLWRQPIDWNRPLVLRTANAHKAADQPTRGKLSAARLIGRNLLVSALSVMLALGAVLAVFQDFASVMRNHKQVRYLINPLNSFYALGRIAVSSAPHASKPLLPIGEDARLGPTYTGQTKPLLLVLVLGETARAANFPLNGYARDTTPHLQALHKAGELVWLNTVWSCGTNTQASVPCMFSHLGKTGHEASDDRHENLLDVLQRAGLAVTWLDNQSGCKGVCDRVPSIDTRETTDPALCQGGECLDGILIKRLPAQLASLNAQARQNGTVVVFHQMGSHGPAYFKRSPASHKPFQPECAQNALQQCSRDEVVNAYDNSLRYTDQMLADTIAWLKQQDAATGLVYLSDHGESLGENNLYLHGLPYALAPDTQKRVPWANWLSPALRQRLKLDTPCLTTLGQQTWSHDNLFHTMLGLADVQTSVHKADGDIFSRCRKP